MPGTKQSWHLQMYVSQVNDAECFEPWFPYPEALHFEKLIRHIIFSCLNRTCATISSTDNLILRWLIKRRLKGESRQPLDDNSIRIQFCCTNYMREIWCCDWGLVFHYIYLSILLQISLGMGFVRGLTRLKFPDYPAVNDSNPYFVVLWQVFTSKSDIWSFQCKNYSTIGCLLIVSNT